MRKTFAALLVASAGVAGGQNLLNNASFEDPIAFDFVDLSNWNSFFGAPGPAQLDANNDRGAPARTGAQAMLYSVNGTVDFNGNDSFVGSIQAVDGIVAGGPYEVSVWARNNGSNLDGSAELRVEWQDAGGAEISRQEIEFSDSLTDEYQRFSFESIAPSGASRAIFVMAAATPGDTGVVYSHSMAFDDASFVLVPAPASVGVLAAAGLIARRRRA